MSPKVYLVGAVYGFAMAMAGVYWNQPAFWVGMVYGMVCFIIGTKEK